MWVLEQDEVSRYIEADPETLYDIIADVTRTPELSPEIVSCEWLDGSGPRVGARFRARNKVTRGPSWTNTPEVLVADRGREFAFARRERPAGELVWRYRLEQKGTGTVVRESYEVTKPIPRLMCHAMRWIWGSKDRPAELRGGMSTTLERLAALSGRAAASAASGHGREESSEPVEDTKEVVRRYLQADEAGFPEPDQVLDPGFVSHQSSSDETVATSEFLSWARALHGALRPTVTVEDMVAEGDRVAVRVTWRGIHTGTFAGVEATGRPIRVSGVGIFRVTNGRVSERWLEFDSAGLMRQLDA